jgi:hypothetical protein
MICGNPLRYPLVAVSNNRTIVAGVLRKVVTWVEINRPDIFVVSADIEWR